MKRHLRLALALFSFSLPAAAFPHLVEPGDTLAKIAERFYGRIQLERVLVTANQLDKIGVTRLTPGMQLEIPAVTYHRVAQTETWKSIARDRLGDERRAIFLAEANGQKPWIEPELGQVLLIPYQLTWVATGEESLATLAYRFLGNTKQAWTLAQYNDLEKRDAKRGEIILLPLTDLPLTEAGKRAAERAAVRLDEQAREGTRTQQQEAQSTVSEVAFDVRAGRYVTAVSRGAELLARENLSVPRRAQVQKLLLEAYVALGALGPARAACSALYDLDPQHEFDPITTSPKILAICADKPEQPRAPQALPPQP